MKIKWLHSYYYIYIHTQTRAKIKIYIQKTALPESVNYSTLRYKQDTVVTAEFCLKPL